MKIRHYIYCIAASVLLVGCSDDMAESNMSEWQADLIGRGVNFSASQADPFTTRVTYRRDGSFNERDIMTIYRQYSEDQGLTFDESTEAYRVYWLETKYATGTSFALETDWRPLVGAMGSNTPGTTFPQTEADSLTWENGKTVRFRAWSRSNLAGAYEDGSKGRYYPDYCVSDWVTVSGPTLDVPLTLKHQGCRIEFQTKSGNELNRAEICTEVEDYRWKDNSTVHDNDESPSEHGKTLEQATYEANTVRAIYEQMCMPAGVDVSTSLLTTMTQELYDNTTNFRNISNSPTGIVRLGEKTAAQVRDEVQRPVFCMNDGRLDLITIPYDMSNDEHEGEVLTLPPFTRIKIWLYDVNNGDYSQKSGEEGTYHIFTLSDIMNKESGNDREQLFLDGMPLRPGYSYRFTVGYHYDRFTITPADNFSWVEQDSERGNGEDEIEEKPETGDYTWWKTAIKSAIPKDISEIYSPEFHITNQKEFLEFIDLVNGTAVNNYVRTHPMTLVPRPEKNYNMYNPVLKDDYRWYPSEYVQDGAVVSGHETDSVTHAEAISHGYIFYEHYYPAFADRAAYSMEDYVSGPYSFYDEALTRRFVVYLNNDLDMYDWLLTPIGNEDPSVRLEAAGSHPFRGIFDGQMHTLKNVNMNGGYMFRHCFDAAIRNVKIETTHDFMLLNTAEARDVSTGIGAYIVGISIKAPSSGNPIARVLTGSSYVVGCIYEGQAGAAMVGTANDLYMFGNMMAATGLPHNTGALLGAYANNVKFFAPQEGTKLEWGRFMANYYLMDRYDNSNSKILHAVGNIPDAYRPQEYIRGALAWVLKQKNDNLLSEEVPFDRLTTELMQKGYYGLAPWKAMNYAIKMYNDAGALAEEPHNCKAHFVNDNVGYANTFPRLVAGEPDSEQDNTGYRGRYDELNLLEQNN